MAPVVLRFLYFTIFISGLELVSAFLAGIKKGVAKPPLLNNDKVYSALLRKTLNIASNSFYFFIAEQGRHLAHNHGVVISTHTASEGF
jgi:hypothetical protein